MRTVVPFSAADPKTRLDPILGPGERRDLARAMLADVLTALRAAGRSPTVLATEPIDRDALLPDGPPPDLLVDDRSLDAAVNDVLAADDDPVAVVMADLPLLTAAAVERLFVPDADVVLAPGLGGGTNAVVARHPDFRVDYHGASIRDHRQIAASVGADLAEVDSRRLATDVDEPDDLAEVLLHADGRTASWLEDAGFSLATDDGRVTVRR